MLVAETGPGRIFVKLRELTGIEHTEDGHIFSYGDWTPLYCIWCTSVWVAVVFMFVPVVLLLPLALSGAAIIIQERLVTK